MSSAVIASRWSNKAEEPDFRLTGKIARLEQQGSDCARHFSKRCDISLQGVERGLRKPVRQSL